MSVLRGKWLTGVAPVLTAAVLAASCAAPVPRQPELGTGGVSAEMLLEASPLSAGAPDDLGAVDILEVTPEMVAFLEARIEGVDNRYARLKRLVDGIMGEENFELVYDDSTRTAAGTFKERRGNCLSFTNMFIAMARQAGIHAEYQEVDIPPDWSIAGDSFLFSQHVNANVDLGAGVIRIVDFNIYDFHTSYDRRVISDQRARAHYFSNIGVDYMLAGDAAQAYGNYRQAILEEPSFEPAWINLGILHRREGFPAHAEAAYLKALELEPSNMVAMSNLANLYDEAGESRLAEIYKGRIRSHRMRNPYYRYRLAQTAVIEGDYKAAIEHLDFAIRKRPNEDRFYFLMGLSQMMNGDEAEAKHWMQQAEQIAAEADGQRYHTKIDRLLGDQADEGQEP